MRSSLDRGHFSYPFRQGISHDRLHAPIERGISIVVTVPGIGPEEENDRTYASEDEALAAGDEIARLLIHRQGPKR